MLFKGFFYKLEAHIHAWFSSSLAPGYEIYFQVPTSLLPSESGKQTPLYVDGEIVLQDSEDIKRYQALWATLTHHHGEEITAQSKLSWIDNYFNKFIVKFKTDENVKKLKIIDPKNINDDSVQQIFGQLKKNKNYFPGYSYRFKIGDKYKNICFARPILCFPLKVKAIAFLIPLNHFSFHSFDMACLLI